MSVVPAISVVVPLYNKAAFVAEAINSVREQSLAAFEIVVVDDGSTDGSAEIVERMAGDDIRLIRQANAGVSMARNRGIDAAQGEYIAFLDADDGFQPDFLAGIARLIERFPRAGMYCTGYTRVWENGHHEESTLPDVENGAMVVVDDFYANWCNGCFTFTSAIVIRRSVFGDSALRFPAGEKLGEDQDLWFRVAECHQVAYLNSPKVDYRMAVSGSATHSSVVDDELPCYRRLSERLEAGRVPLIMERSARRLLASHLMNIARARLSLGDVKGARRLLRDRRALAHPIYYLRTACAVALGALGLSRKGAS